MKKIIFILLTLFIICIGSTCFAAINETELVEALTVVFNTATDRSYSYSTLNDFLSAIDTRCSQYYDDYDNFYISTTSRHKYLMSDFAMGFYNGDVYCDDYLRTTDNFLTFYNIGSPSNFGSRFQNHSYQSFGTFGQTGIYDTNRPSSYISSPVYTNNTFTTLLYSPEPTTPTITGLYNEYMDGFSDINIYIQNNGYYENRQEISDSLSLVITKYDLEGNALSIKVIGDVFLFSKDYFYNKYNEVLDSVSVYLNDFYIFDWDNRYQYKLSLHDYQEDIPLYESDFFEYNVSLPVFENLKSEYTEKTDWKNEPIILNWRNFNDDLIVKLQKWDLEENFISETTISELIRPKNGKSEIILNNIIYSNDFIYNLILMDEFGDIVLTSKDFKIFYSAADPTVEDNNQNIFQQILNIPSLILNGIKDFFVPNADFFGDYFLELNEWFSDRLGIFYFPIDFIIGFFNRISNSEFLEPVINIPAMTLPNFETAGNIIPAMSFNFNDFLDLNIAFRNIYNIYLIVVDGIVILSVIRLMQKKYEEVFNSGS